MLWVRERKVCEMLHNEHNCYKWVFITKGLRDVTQQKWVPNMLPAAGPGVWDEKP